MAARKDPPEKIARSQTSPSQPEANKAMTEKEAESFLTELAKIVKRGDLKKVLANKGVIEGKIKIIGSGMGDVDTMINLIDDYASGKYESVPLWTIATVCAALLYLINPLDLVPDSIPVAGYMDDAAIISACLMLVRENLDRYRQWNDRHV